jgi:hypothetical protein
MDGSKGRESCRLKGKAGRGRPVCRRVPILSKTTGAREKRKFFNGLINRPVQTGEDQILIPWGGELAAFKGVWFEPRHPVASMKLGRAGVSMSFCPAVF